MNPKVKAHSEFLSHLHDAFEKIRKSFVSEKGKSFQSGSSNQPAQIVALGEYELVDLWAEITALEAQDQLNHLLLADSGGKCSVELTSRLRAAAESGLSVCWKLFRVADIVGISVKNREDMLSMAKKRFIFDPSLATNG